MIAKDFFKIYQEFFEPTDQQTILDYSRAFIPFSSINEPSSSKYIYFGNEKIPFKERHPEYQKLFIYEFLISK